MKKFFFSIVIGTTLLSSSLWAMDFPNDAGSCSSPTGLSSIVQYNAKNRESNLDDKNLIKNTQTIGNEPYPKEAKGKKHKKHKKHKKNTSHSPIDPSSIVQSNAKNRRSNLDDKNPIKKTHTISKDTTDSNRVKNKKVENPFRNKKKKKDIGQGTEGSNNFENRKHKKTTAQPKKAKSSKTDVENKSVNSREGRGRGRERNNRRFLEVIDNDKQPY